MLKVSGVCRGVRTQPAKEQGGQPKLFIGIAENKRNGYPGEEEITEVMIPKAMVEKGVAQIANSMQEKLIEIPVFVSARAWKDRAYVDFIMNGDIKQLPSAVPAQGEVRKSA